MTLGKSQKPLNASVSSREGGQCSLLLSLIVDERNKYIPLASQVSERPLPSGYIHTLTQSACLLGPWQGAGKELTEPLLVTELVPGPLQARGRVYNGAVCAPSVTLEQSWAGQHLGSGQEFISLERASPPPPRLHSPVGEADTTLSPSGPGQWDGNMPGGSHWEIGTPESGHELDRSLVRHSGPIK